MLRPETRDLAFRDDIFLKYVPSLGIQKLCRDNDAQNVQAACKDIFYVPSCKDYADGNVRQVIDYGLVLVSTVNSCSTWPWQLRA